MMNGREQRRETAGSTWVREALAELLAAASRPDYHGSVAVEIHVHDGAVQQLRRRLDRIERR